MVRSFARCRRIALLAGFAAALAACGGSNTPKPLVTSPTTRSSTPTTRLSSTTAGTTLAVATTRTVVTSATPSTAQATCTASISDPAPSQHAVETVTIKSNQPSAPISISAVYKTTTLTYTGTTDSAGNGSVQFNIGTAIVGNTVKLTVTIRAATCTTSFTTK